MTRRLADYIANFSPKVALVTDDSGYGEQGRAALLDAFRVDDVQVVSDQVIPARGRTGHGVAVANLSGPVGINRASYRWRSAWARRAYRASNPLGAAAWPARGAVRQPWRWPGEPRGRPAANQCAT